MSALHEVAISGETVNIDSIDQSINQPTMCVQKNKREGVTGKGKKRCLHERQLETAYPVTQS